MTITADTSPSTADLAATNLITNLDNRSPNESEPIEGVDSSLASYKSCFKVTESEIGSSLNHKFIFGVDLGDTYFQHAILVV